MSIQINVLGGAKIKMVRISPRLWYNDSMRLSLNGETNTLGMIYDGVNISVKIDDHELTSVAAVFEFVESDVDETEASDTPTTPEAPDYKNARGVLADITDGEPAEVSIRKLRDGVDLALNIEATLVHIKTAEKIIDDFIEYGDDYKIEYAHKQIGYSIMSLERLITPTTPDTDIVVLTPELNQELLELGRSALGVELNTGFLSRKFEEIAKAEEDTHPTNTATTTLDAPPNKLEIAINDLETALLYLRVTPTLATKLAYVIKGSAAADTVLMALSDDTADDDDDDYDDDDDDDDWQSALDEDDEDPVGPYGDNSDEDDVKDDDTSPTPTSDDNYYDDIPF